MNNTFLAALLPLQNDRNDGSVHLALRNGNNFTADAGMVARMNPVPGDYWMKQADGYVCLNPKDVFERKYHPAATA